MPYQTIQFDVKDGIAHLTLHRPETYNAINETMMDELAAVFYECDRPSVRAVYLTGDGKAFCSGGDVKSFAKLLQGGDPAFRRLPEKLHQAVVAIRRLPKPVIGAVNGVAAGAGFSLAMACDVIVASDEAYFNLAYCRIGLSPDGSSTYCLPRLIGTQRALYYMFTGDDISVEQAKLWGIVQDVYPHAQFREKSFELAQRIAAGPTRALGKAKLLVGQSFNTSLETQLEEETMGVYDTAQSKDFFEGVMAFVEKRPATFTGQ